MDGFVPEKFVLSMLGEEMIEGDFSGISTLGHAGEWVFPRP